MRLPDPASSDTTTALKEPKLARIERALEHARDRTFAFDEFGPLTTKPVDGRPLGARRQTTAVAG